MTLFKQIAIMLSIFLLIILATVLTLNFQSANKSVQDRLYEDAKNTATSLSLSLGNANGDISIMSTMINANFDSGYYRNIILIDVDKKVLYKRETETEVLNIPKWFLNFVNIKAPIANANVSAGWSQVGILNVQSDTTYAYKQLYSIFKSLLISFAIISSLGLIILNLLIHTILRPLKEVQKQAAAVIKNEFIIQKNIPYTKEFKDVVLGMNNMVSKVKAMFDKGNEELKAHKELEYIDQVTKLKNRKYFIDKLPSYLKIDASSKSGVNIILSINEMGETNKKLGHSKMNTFLVNIANIFTQNTKNTQDAVISRMNGTDFFILLPGYSSDIALEITKSIKTSCIDIIESLNLDEEKTSISIGIYEYICTDTIPQLLSRSDNALAQAKFSHSTYIEKSSNSLEVMGKEAWKSIINLAIEKNKFYFVPWSVIDTKNKKLDHHVLSINLTIDKNTSYSYAQFMAPAIEAGLSYKIYKNILNLLFKTPQIVLKAKKYALRLPLEYLEATNSYNEISSLLQTNAATLPFKLIIELPDKLVNNNSALIMQYKKLFDMYNIDIGIFEFIGESDDYQYLQNIKPVYIKGEGNYFLTQNTQSLSALRLITDSVDISIIAVGVVDIKILKELQKKGIELFQGKVTEDLEI
ncbi:MAG: diguanylate cyclase [Sulfurimonas sp.]|nr:diguanylate cyclase [Sulfurimonas sp.]